MLTAKKGSMKLDFPYKAPERENKGDPGKNASRKSRPLGAKGFRGGNHNHEVSSTLSKESGPQGQRHLKEESGPQGQWQFEKRVMTSKVDVR